MITRGRVKLMTRGSIQIRLAFGPESRAFGSWMWIGNDLAQSLSRKFTTSVFRDSLPDADVVVFVKFLPPINVLREIATRSAVVYCPVDLYGNATEIDADANRLLTCDRIVVHCQRLVRYFSSYAPTTYIDHHVKYSIPTRREVLETGPILWVGVRSNLGPLVEWVNLDKNRLPTTLVVLTNVEHEPASPETFGFRNDLDIRIDAWSPAAHCQWLHQCRAALDIKGDDFRSRHKPPAKALDFLASGVPLAMNADSSSAEHLRHWGFEVASPDIISTWFSQEYAHDTQRFGQAVNELLSLPRVSRRWEWLIHEVFTSKHR